MVVAAADVAPWAAQGLGEEASRPRPSGDLSVQCPALHFHNSSSFQVLLPAPATGLSPIHFCTTSLFVQCE